MYNSNQRCLNNWSWTVLRIDDVQFESKIFEQLKLNCFINRRCTIQIKDVWTTEAELFYELTMYIFSETTYKISYLMTKPTKWLCAHRRLRSAWASAIVFVALKGTYFCILFAFPAAGDVQCGGRKTSPRTSTIVQFWSFEISEHILRNQKLLIGLDSYSRQLFMYLDPILIYISLWIDCVCFPLAFVARSWQGHWWEFIIRNCIVWPIYFL